MSLFFQQKAHYFNGSRIVIVRDKRRQYDVSINNSVNHTCSPNIILAFWLAFPVSPLWQDGFLR